MLDPATVDRTAYAYVLGLYLGDGHISVGRRGVYRLTIYCCDSYPGLVEACASAIHALTGGPVERVRKPGCLAVGAWSKQWPVLFPQHGSGRKHDRPIVLERWQEAVVAEHPEELVRGLLHSDGTRCVNRVTRRGKSYEYTRYFFKNESADIQRIFTGALDLLGVAWRQDGRNQISVARREAVARLDEFVGPKY